VKIRVILFFLFILLIKSNYAQECEWLEVGVGRADAFSYSVEADDFNNSIIVGSFRDTFSIKNFGKTYSFSRRTPLGTITESNSFLIKYDQDGQIDWLQQTFRRTPRSSCILYEVKSDPKGNLYVVGGINGAIDFGNNVSASSADSLQVDVALIKYDSSGIAQWARVIQRPGTSNISTGGRIAIDASSNVFLSFSYRGTVDIGGSNQSFTSSGSNDNEIGIVKYSSMGVYLNSLGISGNNGNESIVGMDMDKDDNLFVLFNSPGSISLGGNTYSGSGLGIFKFNSYLNFIRGDKLIDHGQFLFSYGIAVNEDGKIAFSGIFRDSISIGTTSLTSTTSGVRHNFATNTIVLYLDSVLNVKWARKGEGTVSNSSAAPVGGTAIRKGFIYFGGQFSRSDIIWDNTIRMKYVPSAPNLYIAKMDTLGNFLWAFDGGVSGALTGLRRIDADSDGNGILTGGFRSLVRVINKSDTGNKTNNFFTAKVVDFSITRGAVDPGPYCAGDTFEIPYTKIGTYDTGNFFIAELSDSAGNFTGGERELGRVRDTSAGTIQGFLPLFDVATSKNYRIRIISTKPAVQSFFRRDTLRLLIFSKDTANAGPDLLVCKKEPMRLSTTGGSQWNWSPSKFMVDVNDTARINALVAPDSAIEYRIIISDSSGCGLTDTDFVKIEVRDEIQSEIQGISKTCRGQNVVLRAVANGGDSTYWYN